MEWLNKKTVKLSKQETLAYVEAGTKGPTLVLLHGNLSSSYHWMPLIHELKEFYHILAFDLRGFGESSYVNRFDDLFALAEDVRLALNQLNVQHYFAMGWSAGGGGHASMYENPQLFTQIVVGFITKISTPFQM